MKQQLTQKIKAIVWCLLFSISIQQANAQISLFTGSSSNSSFAINSGTLYGWGNSFNAQLGVGYGINKYSPVQLNTATNWASISTGSKHTAAIKSDGTLWVWGYNDFGQLGTGTSTMIGKNKNEPVPVQFGTDNDWAYVACGVTYTIAIKTNGTMWGWGNNDWGQMGNGIRNSNVLGLPAQIGTDNNWASVACGYGQVLAIKTNGTLWGWGANTIGQLGIANIFIDYTLPTQVGSSNNWSKVSCGAYFSAAIKTDGSLWTFGQNGYGQLGDGTTVNKATPTQISGIWSKVSCGYDFTIAIKNDGTIWSCGHNFQSQLGDGTTTDRKSLVQIGIDNNWVTVAAGSSHVIAVKINNSLWAWGANYSGQLGDGTSTNSNTPIPISLLPNSIPSFTGSDVQALSVCQNSSNNSIQNNMTVTDADNTQTLSYSITDNPSHGTITTGGTAASNGGTVSPAGWSYTPAAGYSGTDQFIITVNDGKGGTATNTVSVTINASSTPSVSVAANANNVCAGTSITFTATTTNGGATPAYQWKKNGNNVGSNSATYTDAALNNNDSVWCILTPNTACPTIPTATSNKVKMVVKTNPTIGTSFTLKTVLCGVGATTNANNTNTLGGGVWSSSNAGVVTVVTNAGASGMVTATGAGTATLTYTKTAANGCAVFASTTIAVGVVTPASITNAPSQLCKGSSIALITNISGGAWASLNGAASVASNGVATATANSGTTAITYTLTDANGCTGVTPLAVPVYAQPAVPSISYAAGSINPQFGAVPGTAYCNNRTFTLIATPAGGSWSTTNAAVVTVTAGGVVQTVGTGSGTVAYTVTNANGCSNSRTVIGTVVGCVPRGVNLQQPVVNSQWSIYPNPASTFIRLNVYTLIGSGSIVVTDLYGKQVKQQALSMGTNTVDVSSFAKGMYMVSVITEQGKKTEKLIIE